MRWKLEHILKKEGGGILFEDEYLIILNKPANFLVLPDRYLKGVHNLYELLKECYGNIYIVHRIDKDTSGAVVFAKTIEAHKILNEAFEKQQIEKYYRAIVVGTAKNSEGIIDLPLSIGDKITKIDPKHGKESVTEYKVLEQFQGYASIEIKPLTGRTHQIRVHLSSIGLPILADPLYGNGNSFYLSSIKLNYHSNTEERPLLDRTALHAFSLKLLHPITQNILYIEAQLPKDFNAVLKALRKYKSGMLLN